MGALFVVGWFLMPRPSWDDDEYAKWFVFGVFHFGFRWLPDFLFVLLIAFSLERRRSSRRLYILCAWALVTAGVFWLDVIHPVSPPGSPFEHSLWLRASLDLFAFSWLFVLLIALWICLWLEGRIATRIRKD
jgi:hypothetical protein